MILGFSGRDIRKGLQRDFVLSSPQDDEEWLLVFFRF